VARRGFAEETSYARFTVCDLIVWRIASVLKKDLKIGRSQPVMQEAERSAEQC
jgi:hypothetical protein